METEPDLPGADRAAEEEWAEQTEADKGTAEAREQAPAGAAYARAAAKRSPTGRGSPVTNCNARSADNGWFGVKFSLIFLYSRGK